MQRQTNFFLLIAFFLLGATTLQAQQPNVQARLGASKVAFGDTVSLYIRVENPENALLYFPAPEKSEESQNAIEVYVEQSDTVFGTSQKISAIEHRFLLAAFAEGMQEVKGFEVQYMYPNDSAMQSIPIISIPLEVMPLAVDTTQNIKDILPVEKEPYTFKEFEVYLVLGVSILAIILLVIYFIRRYLNREKIVPEAAKPAIAPDKWALAELENLRQKRLWQHERTKEYYTQLTDVLREYIWQLYQIQAAEMTSDEILEAFRELSLSKEYENLLAQVLRTSDLVKFAKSQPLPNEHDANMNNAVAFVTQTMADRRKLLEQRIQEALNKNLN